MMNQKINYDVSIPVKYETDVFVAGGGPAGIAAAVSAARTGAKVYLAESQGCFGGMGTAALVPVFMQFSDGVRNVAAGIGEEILERLRGLDGTGDEYRFTIKAEVLKRLYDDMLVESGADFSFQTHLIDVQKEGDRVAYAILYSKSGIFAVKAKVFIDCTGDGDLAVMAGASYRKGDDDGSMMPGTLCSLWAGIDWDIADRDPAQPRMLEQAFADGVFTVQDREMPGIWRTGAIMGGGNLGHAYGLDSTNTSSVTAAFTEQRRRLVEYEKYFKNYLNGFEKMELVSSGNLMGVRESRRILGDYVLNLDDFNNRAVFDDEIGRYCYWVDIHSSGAESDAAKNTSNMRARAEKYGKGDSYGIPYRTLIPKGLSNVLVAGRCVSCDRYVLASIRVMPGCFITGQAAGAAAAIAASNHANVRDVDVQKLQDTLKNAGAYLPNFRSE